MPTTKCVYYIKKINQLVSGSGSVYVCDSWIPYHEELCYWFCSFCINHRRMYWYRKTYKNSNWLY